MLAAGFSLGLLIIQGVFGQEGLQEIFDPGIAAFIAHKIEYVALFKKCRAPG